jgi:hypothetical protein
MPNANVQFQGQTLPIPGAYYADNVSATLPANPALVPPMIFIANGFGGKYCTPYNYAGGAGLSALQAAMRGGPGAAFVPFIANPSPTLYGASQVTYINVANNTPSSITLSDASGHAIIELTSADYGPPSNLLQAEVDSGSQAGIMLTLYDGYSGNAMSADNLGFPLAIAYTGALSSASFTVAAVSGQAATALTLTDGAVSGQTVTFPLGTAQYGTVQQLVTAINAGSQPFTARVLPNVSNAQQTTNTLDAATGSLPAPTNSVPNFVNIPGSKGGINTWVNTFASGLATSIIATSASGATAQFPALQPLTHFTGATYVPPTNNDYINALAVAATLPGWVVFCDSNAEGVVMAGAQHAFDMSQPDIGKPRRFISGSSIGDTTTAASTMALDMGAYQGTYVYPGIYAINNSTNVNTLYGGLYAAAAVASMICGNQIAQPLTMQPLVGTGVEVQLTEGAGGQIDLLQQTGVMPIYVSPDDGQVTIISDFTTWQTDNNPENIFNQQVACRQALQYSMRQGLRPYVGSIASPYGMTAMKNAATSILNQLIYSPGNNGILVSWDTSSLSLTYSGETQAVSLTVNVVFVGQVRFILELTFVQPLSLAA